MGNRPQPGKRRPLAHDRPGALPVKVRTALAIAAAAIATFAAIEATGAPPPPSSPDDTHDNRPEPHGHHDNR